MATPKPFAKMVQLRERLTTDQATISFSGFVGQSEKGRVRLYTTPSGNEYMEIPEASVREFEQDESSGVTDLFIDTSAIVTVVTMRRVPITAAVFRLRDDNGGSGGGAKTCLEKRIEACKSDPDVRDKSFCDSDKAKRIFRFFCDVLGDPNAVGGGVGPIA